MCLVHHSFKQALGRVMVAWCVIAMSSVVAHAQVNILTNRYDVARTGANLQETRLTTANVSAARFGRLFAYPVDGAVYAQPLYVSGVPIAGALRNVLYVATMNDKVYAFDADSSSGTPLWRRDFTNPPAVTPVPITDIVPGNLNVIGNVGVQSTPVIDRTTQTMYLVARTKENGSYVQRLRALDITTGLDRPASPVVIGGSVPGKALDAVNGSITFNPKMQLQRAGLTLSNGVVVVGWAAHEDYTPSHGWIMGFDAATLERVAIRTITPDAYLGGIWQGGRAPAQDASGNLYVATGNGLWDGVRNFGNSLLKFQVSRAGLTLVDYFTPTNEALLNLNDDDLGGSGFTLLPGTSLLLGGGKEGVLYLVNGANLGHKQTGDAGVVQRIKVYGGHVMGGPVYWKSATAGPLVYNWSESDELKAYSLKDGTLGAGPYAQGAILSPGHPGGSLAISANGAAAGTGIVWASMNADRDAKHGLAPGILRAFHAETLQELWHSNMVPTRDRVGTLMKFVPPVVANGRVYVPNHDNQILVYGLLTPDFGVAVIPSSAIVIPGSPLALTVTLAAEGGFNAPVSLRATLPAGWTAAFAADSVIPPDSTTLRVTAPGGTPPGTYGVMVSGVNGAVTRNASVALTVGAAAGTARPIGIDFVGNAAGRMSTTETAGVVVQAYWNAGTGAVSPTPLALVDALGASTPATVSWAAYGTWATSITEQAGNPRMMKGYLDTSSSSTTTVTIAGLTQGKYDVYVYVDGDNKVYPRSGSYTVTVPGVPSTIVTLTDAASSNFAGTFVPASNSVGNYFKASITGTGFTLTGTPLMPASGTRRAPINGLQIIPVDVRPPVWSIDFVGDAAQGMSAGETAGVMSQAHWNTARGAASGSPLALVDAAGNASNVTVSWSAPGGTWATPITEAPGNARMMKGYLDTTSTSVTTVKITGLTTGTYDVYVYVDGANSSYTRTGGYTISTPVAETRATLTDKSGVNFGGTLVAGTNGTGNYLKFRISGDQFTLTAVPGAADTATRRAPVNGIQVVKVP